MLRAACVAFAITFFRTGTLAAEGIDSVRGKTVMVVQAHPDDSESRFAGAIALLKKHGNRIIYVVATRDDKGTYDINADPNAHAALRKREEEEAVKVLRVDVLEWLGYDDGWLDMVPRDKLRGDLVRMLRKYKPDILFAFDPRNEDEHTDHRAAAFAAMDAVTAAPLPLYFPDHINPYLDKQPVKENGFGAAEESGHLIAAEALGVLRRMRPHTTGQETLEVEETLLETPNRWDPSKRISIGISTVLLNKSIGLLAVPGEAFVEFQKGLSDQSPVAQTLFVGHCYSAGGVWAGYLPTIAASSEGGYGAGYSTNVDVGTGEMVVREALVNFYRMLGKLQEIPER